MAEDRGRVSKHLPDLGVLETAEGGAHNRPDRAASDDSRQQVVFVQCLEDADVELAEACATGEEKCSSAVGVFGLREELELLGQIKIV